jgi:peptide/nickel transport system substrate-binding protein
MSGAYPGYVYLNWWWTQLEFLNAVAPDPIQLGSDYKYRPILLTKLPSLEDGDAALETVRVRVGDNIVNDAGEVAQLQEGMIYRPAGCRESACAAPYAGGDVQMERLVVTFRLLPDLKWSDGAPLTARDSVLAYQLVRDAQGKDESVCASCGLPDGAVPGTLQRTVEYTAVDEHTVRWIGLPGYLTRWYFLNFFSPLPQHLAEGKTLREIDKFTGGASGANMVGWGPFMVEEWVQGQYLRVVRNPHYHHAEEGLPHLDEIVWKFLTDEPGRGVAGVLTGECDVASGDATLRDTSWGKGLELYQGIQASGKLQVYVIPVSWEGVAFNVAPPADRPDFFTDPRVRQAIAYGTDRQTIAEVVVGDSFLAHSYVPAYHPLYAGDALTFYDLSPQRARELLAEAGWEDTDGDGMVEKNGQPFIITLLDERPQPRAPGLAIFQMNMAEIGIKVRIEYLAVGALLADDGPLATRRFDLLWSLRPITPYSEGGNQPACTTFLTRAIPQAGQIRQWDDRNEMGYRNLEFDALCQLGLTSLDPQEAGQAHLLAQQILSRDLPILPLYFRSAVVLARPGVMDLMFDSAGAITVFEALDIQSSP